MNCLNTTPCDLMSDKSVTSVTSRCIMSVFQRSIVLLNEWLGVTPQVKLFHIAMSIENYIYVKYAKDNVQRASLNEEHINLCRTFAYGRYSFLIPRSINLTVTNTVHKLFLVCLGELKKTTKQQHENS